MSAFWTLCLILSVMDGKIEQRVFFDLVQELSDTPRMCTILSGSFNIQIGCYIHYIRLQSNLRNVLLTLSNILAYNRMTSHFELQG
jgi:hypothetical protein